MKKCVFALALLVSVLACYAQNESRIHSPNFLVENQLSPEALKVEYAMGFRSADFQSAHTSERHGIKRNTLTISGSPFAVVNKEHQQLYLGFSWVREDFNVSGEPFPGNIKDRTFHNVSLNTFYNTKLCDRFYLTFFLQHSIQSTDLSKDLRRSYNSLMLAKINYKVNPNTNFGLGAIYVSDLGDAKILPAVSAVHSTRYFLLNLDFPVKAEVEGLLAHGTWRPVIGVLFPNSTYRVTSSDQYLNTSGFTAYLGCRYRVAQAIYLHAAWQSVLNEEIKFGSRGQLMNAGSADGQSRVVVSMNVQIPVKHPVH